MKVLLFLVALLSSILAQDIDIKGLKIGMSYDEANKLFKLDQYNKVVFATQKNGKKPTFASVEVDYIALHFKNKIITNIGVKFDSSKYNTVIEPLKDKYKNMTCRNSIIQNRMGAKFNQEECFLSNGITNLSIEKYSEKITESYITLYKQATKEESEESKEKIKKDI